MTEQQTEEQKACPTCGRAYKKKSSIALYVIVGGVMGFCVGISFVSYWFGTSAGYLHTMALIHEVAGTALGMLTGLIICYLRRLG